MENKLLLGIFADTDNAEEAISELETAGYNAKDISLIMKDQGAAQQVSQHTGATNVAGGAASGATTGAVIGGLAGLLSGIGAITVPGIGGLLVAGPVATALGLTGAAATTVSGALTGALAGGLLGALVGLGVPEEDARVYEERVNGGAILIAVPLRSGREDDAREILEEAGADQIRTITMRAPHHTAPALEQE